MWKLDVLVFRNMSLKGLQETSTLYFIFEGETLSSPDINCLLNTNYEKLYFKRMVKHYININYEGT